MARKKKDDSGPASYTDDEMIVKEAKERFTRCVDWESDARMRFLEDVKFYNADSDNGYQWPSEIRKARDVDRRPMLTINKTRQYCLNVTNDARQNKPSIKVRPVGDTATFEGAQVMEGIVRHIEYQSNAQSVYDRANGFQVQGGVGYWRVLTEYADSDSFDQEIFIRPVKDPMSVYIDPDVNEADASDARFAFIYEDVPSDKFDYEYPEFKDKVGSSALGQITDWIQKDHTRVAEYYRRVEKIGKLIMMIDPESGEQIIINAEKVPAKIMKAVLDEPNTKTREVKTYEVEWFKIAGDLIIEKGKWAGSTIPIVRIVGEESVIEGQMDRKGHVRGLKDPQRIYNYWSSSAVEFVALQSKTPYIAPAKAIQGYETYWTSANNVNHSILPYNHMDDDGNPIPSPERQEPPTMSNAYMAGMQTASEEMRMASGQYQADMGEPGNERSGKAINARQRQGDNATYHFIDNQAIGIRYTGKIVIELIPIIYDTKRTIKIMGQDGVESAVLLDPAAKQEFVREKMQDVEKIKIIFNPSFAKYSVEADVGPAYATRRQEAFNAFTQIMAAQPELMKIAGDLMFRAADFPMADELAERLKRLVPPEVLGNGPSPQVQQLMMQNKNLSQHIQTLMEQYASERVKHTAEEQQKEIDVFKAETDRLKVILGNMDPQQIASMTAQLVLESMQTQLPIQSIADGLAKGPNGSGGAPPAAAIPALPPPSPAPVSGGSGAIALGA